MCVCVFSNIFSETTGPTEAKFHVEPPWDRGRKFIQMVQVICCSSLLSTSGGAGAFSRDFTINLSPQFRAFSRALKTEKLKAPLFPDPVGAGTTNDWCITFGCCPLEIYSDQGANFQGELFRSFCKILEIINQELHHTIPQETANVRSLIE